MSRGSASRVSAPTPLLPPALPRARPPAGQLFAGHIDGSFTRRDARGGHDESVFSVLLYLNDGFAGGSTRFTDRRLRGLPGSADDQLSVVPEAGMALFYRHRGWFHESVVVENGIKYMARTDAMYVGSAGASAGAADAL